MKENKSGKPLLEALPPEEAKAIVLRDISDMWQSKLYHVDSDIAWFKPAPHGLGEEVYQIRVCFFLTDTVAGSPLFESYLVMGKEKILCQRRGAAEE